MRARRSSRNFFLTDFRRQVEKSNLSDAAFIERSVFLFYPLVKEHFSLLERDEAGPSSRESRISQEKNSYPQKACFPPR